MLYHFHHLHVYQILQNLSEFFCFIFSSVSEITLSKSCLDGLGLNIWFIESSGSLNIFSKSPHILFSDSFNCSFGGNPFDNKFF